MVLNEYKVNYSFCFNWMSKVTVVYSLQYMYIVIFVNKNDMLFVHLYGLL